MTRQEEAMKIAKRLVVIDLEIEKLQAERGDLEARFAKYIPGDAHAEEVPPVMLNGREPPAVGDTPTQVLRFMSAHHQQTYTPSQLARELSVPAKRLRTVLLRFDMAGDRRITKVVGSHGFYKFNSITKEKHA